ncbi:MAG: hypothetical protein ACOZNI_30445 [Myxococcota bacterium]
MEVRFEPASSLTREVDFSPLWETRGIYVVYSTGMHFRHTRGGNDIAYIGCGWIGERLHKHVNGNGNHDLFQLLPEHGPGRGYLRFVFGETGTEVGARTAESALLPLFYERYGSLPFCNRRDEVPPPSRIKEVTFNRDFILERHAG